MEEKNGTQGHGQECSEDTVPKAEKGSGMGRENRSDSKGLRGIRNKNGTFDCSTARLEALSQGDRASKLPRENDVNVDFCSQRARIKAQGCFLRYCLDKQKFRNGLNVYYEQ